MSIPWCASQVRLFSVIPGVWLRSRPQCREMGPTGRDSMAGAAKAIGRALGHGAFQVISLFLQLPSALRAHPTELQLRTRGRLQQPLSWSRISPLAFPRKA